MERERSAANDEVAKESDKKHLIVLMSIAIQHPDDSKIDEDEVGKGVYHLSDVSSKPIIFLAPCGERVSIVRLPLKTRCGKPVERQRH